MDSCLLKMDYNKQLTWHNIKKKIKGKMKMMEQITTKHGDSTEMFASPS